MSAHCHTFQRRINMQDPEFFTDDLYKGTGISMGLARGLQVRAGGVPYPGRDGSGGKTFFARKSEVLPQ